METIVVTGSPGAGKTSVCNDLAEKFRVAKIPHVVIDPDEISRVFPEDSLSRLKWDGLAKLYPLYKEYPVDKVIVPVTIDEDSDLDHIHSIFGETNVTVFTLIVDEEVLVNRVTEREPNEYWQEKLSDLVRGYLENGKARTFKTVEIHTAGLAVSDISSLIAPVASHP